MILKLHSFVLKMQIIDMQVIYGTVGRLFTICHFSQVNKAENIQRVLTSWTSLSRLITSTSQFHVSHSVPSRRCSFMPSLNSWKIGLYLEVFISWSPNIYILLVNDLHGLETDSFVQYYCLLSLLWLIAIAPYNQTVKKSYVDMNLKRKINFNYTL